MIPMLVKRGLHIIQLDVEDLCQSLWGNIVDEVRRLSKNSERNRRLIYVRLGEYKTRELHTSMMLLTIKDRGSLQIDLITCSENCKSARSGRMTALIPCKVNRCPNNLVDS